MTMRWSRCLKPYASTLAAPYKTPHSIPGHQAMCEITPTAGHFFNAGFTSDGLYVCTHQQCTIEINIISDNKLK